MRTAKLSRISVGFLGLVLLTCSSESGRSTDAREFQIPTLRAIFGKPFIESSPETHPRTVARVASVVTRDGECVERWHTAIEAEVQSCRVVLLSRGVVARLKALPESPPSVLQALLELRDSVDSLSSALSNEQEGPGEGPSADPSADGVRRRMSLEGNAPSDCAERVPSELETLVEQRFRAELVGEALVEDRRLGFRPSPLLRDTKQLLDAIFALDVLRVPTVTHCVAEDSPNFEWDPTALDMVTSTLESWRPKDLPSRLRSVPQGPTEAIRSITEAIPGAVCDQLRRLACRDLTAVRRSGGDEAKAAMNVLAARGRARSLKRALPALGRLHRAVTAWGCSAAEFGLDEVPRYAKALLDVATWQLTERTQAFAAGSLRESPDLTLSPRESAVDPASSHRRTERIENNVREELRVYRQEVAAIAFVIAAPAVEALSSVNSPDDPAKSAWVDLFADLKGTNQRNPLGESGLIAFEQLLGLLLVEPNSRCPSLVAPWAPDVFNAHEGLFFQQGRRILEALAPHCASDEGR